MADFSFELDGVEELLDRLDGATRRVMLAGSQEIRLQAEGIMTKSRRLVPVDTGALRASGRVEDPNFETATRVVAELSYGGSAAPYALYVHEDLNARHSVGQAKYLEQPVRAALPGFVRAVTSALDRSLGL